MLVPEPDDGLASRCSSLEQRPSIGGLLDAGRAVHDPLEIAVEVGRLRTSIWFVRCETVVV